MAISPSLEERYTSSAVSSPLRTIVVDSRAMDSSSNSFRFCKCLVKHLLLRTKSFLTSWKLIFLLWTKFQIHSLATGIIHIRPFSAPTQKDDQSSQRGHNRKSSIRWLSSCQLAPARPGKLHPRTAPSCLVSPIVILMRSWATEARWQYTRSVFSSCQVLVHSSRHAM